MTAPDNRPAARFHVPDPGQEPTMQPQPATPVAGAAPGTSRLALVVVTSIFFMWGFLTCLNDILIPHLKASFELSWVQAMLIQFTFFGAYFLMSLPRSEEHTSELQSLMRNSYAVFC